MSRAKLFHMRKTKAAPCVRELIVLSLIGVLGACSHSNAPVDATAPAATTAATAPVANTQLTQEFAMYQQLLKSESFELAGPIGAGIVQRFPQSNEAAQVKQTLTDVQAKGVAMAEQRRMQRLWAYQTGNESGGTQNTASIYSNSADASSERIRLVLRRHSAWGLSVYLFGSGKGFECRGVCMLPAQFDGKAERIAAYLPETDDPALFIKDERGFIARLTKIKRISIEATLKGKPKQAFVFDVGGYDPTRFPDRPKATAKSGKK
ncbi:MAG: hypothetical protein ABI451_02085 [Dokdonella sp.]